ncbi:hypothetical protein ACLB1E_37445 [Escherichia coli]
MARALVTNPRILIFDKSNKSS